MSKGSLWTHTAEIHEGGANETDDVGRVVDRRLPDSQIASGELIEQTNAEKNVWLGPNPTYESIRAAQSFTPTEDGILTYIEVLLESRGGATTKDILRCDFMDGDGQVLDTTTAVGFDDPTKWVRFTFCGTNRLKAGEKYRLAVFISEGYHSYNIYWDDDVYAGGHRYELPRGQGWS